MHPQPTQHTLRRAGFTLLELIGVMAVIAILSAALLPGAIDMIRVQRAVNDRAELPKIAEALKRGMLREQVFPIYENAASVSTDGNDAYWWNLAARHGGGSANAVRYPLGIRPGSTTTRKLYFAEASWSGKSFSEFTGDGLDWLNDFQDPTELRLLLISTTNPDLSLPDELDNDDKFNAFWDDWAVGSDGDPASGDPASDDWADYGLSSTEWEGRATELNVQRIDLRDWLCTVVIENRRAIEEDSGADLSSALSSALGFWDRGSVSVSSTNLQDAAFIIQARDTTEDLNQNNLLDSGEDANGNGVLDSGEDLNGNGVLDSGEDLNGNTFLDHPAQIYSYVEAVIQTQRGRRLIPVEDPSGIPLIAKPATVIIRGRRASTAQSITANLTLTDLAPIALINSDDGVVPLYDFVNDFGLSENRYFLKTQELRLGEPWTFAEVGIFTITEPFSTLRFDGLQWHY
jgi:prepilin-type N-terminal cleavage/methylation domain-containing protein